MKTKPPLKVKPEYEGSTMWRTNNKMKYKCGGCTRFATHVALGIKDRQRVYLCPTHTRKFIAADLIHQVEPFLEYKRYLADVEQWKQQNQTAIQETLI